MAENRSVNKLQKFIALKTRGLDNAIKIFLEHTKNNANQPEHSTKDTGISPEGFFHISPIYRTSGEPNYERPIYLIHSIGAINHRLDWKRVVKLSHDPAIRVVTRRMMCLIEYQKAYVPSEIYISMSKSI